MDFSHMDTDSLGEECKRAFAKHFLQKRKKDYGDSKVTGEYTNALAMELFRRAIVAKDDRAIQHIMDIFEPMVRTWVYSERQFRKTNLTASYFVSWAFVKLFSKVTPEKYPDFPSIGHILRYLNLCARTNVRQYFRDNFRIIELDLPPDLIDPGAQRDEETIIIAEFWAMVFRILPSEKEQRLVRLYYLENYKPSEIAKLYPDLWKTAQQVSTMLYRIHKKLRNHQEFRDWFKRD